MYFPISRSPNFPSLVIQSIQEDVSVPGDVSVAWEEVGPLVVQSVLSVTLPSGGPDHTNHTAANTGQAVGQTGD